MPPDAPTAPDAPTGKGGARPPVIEPQAASFADPAALVAQLGIRDTPPDPADPAWRGDCLSRAHHTRLVAPVGGPAVARLDRERTGEEGKAAGEGAEALCAGLTRDLLGDFAPALLLLPATERCRARALIAYARLLFDFARQPGPQGERLAGIERCEYALEQALANLPVGQPILLRVAQENARRRWPPDALDELAAWARRGAMAPMAPMTPHAVSAAVAEAEARSLARALGTALLEDRINSEVTGFGSALVRLHSLRRMGQEAETRQEGPAAIARECARLRPRLLRAPRGLVELPAPYRRAGVFCLLVALRRLSEMEEAGTGLVTAPRRLGAGTRIGMLLRARWFSWSGGRAGDQ
jgi:hypothetical protein